MYYKETPLKELNLCDDFLFAKVMEDPEICRLVLEKILNRRLEKITCRPTIQKVIENTYESRGVRLDVYVQDERGTVYNIEMQTVNRRDLAKRSRYYQGAMDLDFVRRGESYENLNRSIIIFICTFDPFGKGNCCYSFTNGCRQYPGLELGDETEKIFLNTKGRNNDVGIELKEFLNYVEDSTDCVAQHSSIFVGLVHKKVSEVKENKKAEVEYMTLLMREKERYEEGREEGIRACVEFMKEDRLPEERILERIRKRFGLSQEEARYYLQGMEEK